MRRSRSVSKRSKRVRNKLSKRTQRISNKRSSRRLKE